MIKGLLNRMKCTSMEHYLLFKRKLHFPAMSNSQTLQLNNKIEQTLQESKLPHNSTRSLRLIKEGTIILKMTSDIVVSKSLLHKNQARERINSN